MLVAFCAALAAIALAVASAGVHQPERGPKTWTIEDGTSTTLAAADVRPDDTFTCSDGVSQHGAPDAGHGVGSSAGIQVTTALDGSVTVTCEAGPPGNV